MADGTWRSAAEVAIEMSNRKMKFTSPNQLGSLLTNTPGFENRRATERWRFGLGMYRLYNQSLFEQWIEVKKP